MQGDELSEPEFQALIADGADLCDKIQELIESEQVQDRVAFLGLAMAAANCCVNTPVISPAAFEKQIELFVETATEWEDTQT